jgi:hypothetical protein
MDPKELERTLGIPVAKIVIGNRVDPSQNAAARALFEKEIADRDPDDPRVAMPLSMLAAIERQQGNHAEAMALLDRALAAAPEWFRPATMLAHAEIRLDSGDVENSLPEYDALLELIQSLPDRDRDIELPLMAAQQLRDHDPERALDWVESGLRLVLRGGGNFTAVEEIFHEYRSVAAACDGKKMDPTLYARVDWYLRQISPSSGSDRAVVGYFPPSTDPASAPIREAIGMGEDDDEDHRHQIERMLRTAISPAIPKYIAIMDVAGLVTFAADNGMTDNWGAAAQMYATHLANHNRATRWPPGPNQPCWCGSSAKYKKCCGRPDLLDPVEEALRQFKTRTGEGWQHG